MKTLIATPYVRRRSGNGLRRLRTRRRWTWRSLLHRPIPHLVGLFAAMAGLYILATSSLFAITTVEVIGDPRVPPSLLRASCHCIGKNIFLAHPEQIQQHLERTPWIQVRQAYERLPNRVIVDAAYRPVAVLWRTKAATYTVDTAGTILYDLKRPPVPAALVPTTRTVPLVYSPYDTTFTPGQRILLAPKPIAIVEAVQAALSPVLRPSIDRYRWSPYSGLAGHTTLGWWFFLGEPSGATLSARVRALNAAQAQHIPGRSHCNYIDFQAMPYPYCRFSPQWQSLTGPPT